MQKDATPAQELAPIVERHLREFERSESKALQARARAIRARIERERAIVIIRW